MAQIPEYREQFLFPLLYSWETLKLRKFTAVYWPYIDLSVRTEQRGNRVGASYEDV